MAIDLPAGSAGVGGATTAAPPPQAPEEEKSFLQKAADIPEALYRAATGEGAEIEFPDIPEATEVEDIGFFEALIPNLKIMMARDDAAKAEIIKSSYEGDERFGGTYSDKYGNPMVVWNDQAYYINKPGFSGQDLGTFVGEIAKYMPATKFVSGAKTIPGIVGRGAATYPGTELASEALEAQMAPETARAKGKTAEDIAKSTALATGLGVGADVIVPGVLKPGVRAARVGTQKAVESSLPALPEAFRPVAEKVARSLKPKTVTESVYPLTAGQRGAKPPVRGVGERVTPQLEKEDVIRRAPSTDEAASSIVRGFDERQLDMIRADAQALKDEFGSGMPALTGAEDVPGAVAEQIQATVSRAARDIKKEAGKGYKLVREAELPPVFDKGYLIETGENAINAVFRKMGITQRELADMPILRREINYLRNQKKVLENPETKQPTLAIIHGYQKSLNRALRSAEQGSPEQLALSEIKGVIDDAVNNGIERGFIYGDEAILEQLKKSTDLYRQYIGLSGKGAGRDSQERAANKILEMITNPNYTPVQVARAILGHSKFNPNQSMTLVIDRLKQNLPGEDANVVMSLIKDGILEKAFSGAGKSGVTRTNIVNNFEDVFVKQKAIIEKLFTPDEISKIRSFRDNVLPTLWAEIKLNPSGSGYTILSGLARSNLLNYTRMVPIVGGGIAEGAERVAQTSRAMDAVRQYIDKSSMPLFTAPIAAAVRPEVEAEVEDTSAVLPLIDSLSPEARQKIININQ